jgi:hypothetical protein
MALQTSNILLIIRCFTKYIIEIENENALMEQMNVKYGSTISNSTSNNDDLDARANAGKLVNDQMSSSSSNASPLRQTSKTAQIHKEAAINSRENSLNENDSDPDSVQTRFVNDNNESENKSDVLYQLIKNIFELCIEVPVE